MYDLLFIFIEYKPAKTLKGLWAKDKSKFN